MSLLTVTNKFGKILYQTLQPKIKITPWKPESQNDQGSIFNINGFPVYKTDIVEITPI